MFDSEINKQIKIVETKTYVKKIKEKIDVHLGDISFLRNRLKSRIEEGDTKTNEVFSSRIEQSMSEKIKEAQEFLKGMEKKVKEISEMKNAKKKLSTLHDLAEKIRKDLPFESLFKNAELICDRREQVNPEVALNILNSMESLLQNMYLVNKSIDLEADKINITKIK